MKQKLQFSESTELELTANAARDSFLRPGFFSHHLLQCTSIPLFLRCSLSSVVARQPGVCQESYHPAQWDCGQAVGKMGREKFKFNKMQPDQLNPENALTPKLILIASCILLSLAATETTHYNTILFQKRKVISWSGKMKGLKAKYYTTSINDF